MKYDNWNLLELLYVAGDLYICLCLSWIQSEEVKYNLVDRHDP